MEVVKEQEEQKVEQIDKDQLTRQEIGYRQMIRFALLEQSIINFQAYLNKMVESNFAHNTSHIGSQRQSIIDKNASNPKVKLRVPSMRSMMKDCERQRDFNLGTGKDYIERQFGIVQNYKKNLPETSLKYYEEYASLIGAFAHKILEMDDPKKVLLLLQFYNEGMFDSVFKELEKSVKKVEEELQPVTEPSKTEPNEKVEDN